VQRLATSPEQNNSWGFFVQDDWKVSKSLTVTIGLRWGVRTALHERYNRSVLALTRPYVQPFSATAAANYQAKDAALISQIPSISPWAA